MKLPSFLKRSVLSAMIFFGTLGALSVGYATWTSMTGSYSAGDNLTATLWNNLVENVNDLDTRVTSTAADTQTALSLKADIASPAFTGSPTAPTQNNGTSDTTLATTAFVETRVASAASTGGGSVFGLFVTNCPSDYLEYGKVSYNYASQLIASTSGCFASVGNVCNLGGFGTYKALGGTTWAITLNSTNVWTQWYVAVIGTTSIVLCGK